MQKERVQVWDGDGETRLGRGWYVGDVTVFAWQTDIGLLSLRDAETKPSPALVEQMAEEGCLLIELLDNPKIEMDDGTIQYGCQVWWKRIDD